MKVSLKKSFIGLFIFILIICYSFLTYRKVDISELVGGSVSTFMTSKTRPSRPSISLFVRMSGKLKKHQTRFYCDFFRTAALFLPPSLGKTVLVLEEESKLDHRFGEQVTRQVRQYLPEQKIEVKYTNQCHTTRVF